MTTTRWFRRTLIATMILTAILTTFPAAQASAATREARYTYYPNKVCPIDWRRGPYYVKQLIRCSANHFHVSVTKALAVANRESHFRPRAYNRYSCAMGVFQHLCRYWPGRAYAYGFRDWSAYNARANIIVSMRMVRRVGWGPWGG